MTSSSVQLTFKEGEAVETDEATGQVLTVITTKHPVDNPHNFGPASSRDTTVWTCQRPGGDVGDGKIPTETVVQDWAAFMKQQQIQHVIILLDENELESYEPPGLLAAYKQFAPFCTVHFLPLLSEGSFDKIINLLDELHSKGERAVAHCTHGMGRSGRVAAAWLVHKYGLCPEEATEEVLVTAREHKVERLGAPAALKKWMASS